MAILYLDTDHVITVTGLKDSDDAAVTGATVTAKIINSSDGSEVSGATWPVTLTGDGAGNYTGQLPDEVSITYSGDYLIEVVAEDGSLKRTWQDVVKPRRGGF